MMKRFAKTLLVLVCACNTALASDYQSLTHLHYIKDSTDESTPVFEGSKTLRAKAQKETALTLGAQYGYEYAMTILKKQIENQSDSLDRIFDFNSLMKVTNKGFNQLYLLPPVVTEVKDLVNLASDAQSLRTSHIRWQKVKEERLVTAPPNWRQYLIYDMKIEIPQPANMLLPKDSEEQHNWASWIREGWSSGMQQADREMNRRVSKLHEFNGMLRYKLLVSQNKMTPTTVASTYEEVSSTTDAMFVNDRTLVITGQASFNTHADQWKTFILDNRGSLRTTQEQAALSRKFAPDTENATVSDSNTTHSIETSK